jgi:hypothetical protein
MHFEDFSHLEAGTDLSSMNLDQDRNDLKIIENVLVHGREVGEGSVCVVRNAWSRRSVMSPGRVSGSPGLGGSSDRAPLTNAD